MKIWLLFNGIVEPDFPEAHACMRIQEEAEKQGHILKILNPENFDLLVDSTGDWQASYLGEKIEAPDAILPRTGSETTYAGFAVLRFYEAMGVPLLNSSQAVQRCADKLFSQQILAAHKIPLPKTMLGHFPADLDLVEKKIGFPLVVKTLSGTRGGGVFLTENKEKFKDLTDLLAETNSNVHFIFQEYISRSHGRDLRVFTVHGKVVACMERQSVDGSFKSNISRGGHGTLFEPTPEIEKMAARIVEIMEIDVAGIDLLFDESGFRVCEVNSSPDFKGLEAATSVNVAKILVDAVVAKTRSRQGLWDKIKNRVKIA